MIESRSTNGGRVRVTFVLPPSGDDGQVAVVGDFNDWDPLATPLQKRRLGPPGLRRAASWCFTSHH